MNAYSSDFFSADGSPAGPAVSSGCTAPDRDVTSAIDEQWDALHDAAAAVAVLAGLPPQAQSIQQRSFPTLIQDVSGWRLDLARNGLNDIAAIMQPGLAALLAVNARGQEPAPAALALWQEFEHARDGLLELAPYEG
jgi:hypothetical protein